MIRPKQIIVLLLSIAVTFCNNITWAHGFAGQRFFPATIAIDDPFAGDEFNISVFRTESPADGGGNSWTTNPTVEWDKRITERSQVSIAGSYLHIKNPGQPAQNGFDDWTVGAIYELIKSAEYETIFSLFLNAEIGGTGSHIVQASTKTTLTPGILFGQGFGALPDQLKYLRPIAITGVLDADIESSHGYTTGIDWGIVFEYSLPYMQSFVQTTGLPTIMNHVIPLIEFPMTTCTKGDCSGQTTGTVNPGLLIVGKYGQLGLEAIIPVNQQTGRKAGGVIQFHLYLDDIFPNSIGKPLFT